MIRRVFFGLVLVSLVAVACGGGDQSEKADGSGALTGMIRVDGSSTVFPITEAVAEEFQSAHPRVRVTVGISGTGGGFKKFCVGETDLNDASRPIKEKEIQKALGHKDRRSTEKYAKLAEVTPVDDIFRQRKG